MCHCLGSINQKFGQPCKDVARCHCYSCSSYCMRLWHGLYTQSAWPARSSWSSWFPHYWGHQETSHQKLTYHPQGMQDQPVSLFIDKTNTFKGQSWEETAVRLKPKSLLTSQTRRADVLLQKSSITRVAKAWIWVLCTFRAVEGFTGESPSCSFPHRGYQVFPRNWHHQNISPWIFLCPKDCATPLTCLYPYGPYKTLSWMFRNVFRERHWLSSSCSNLESANFRGLPQMLVSTSQPINTSPRQSSSDLTPFLTLSDPITSYLDCPALLALFGNFGILKQNTGICLEWWMAYRHLRVRVRLGS